MYTAGSVLVKSGLGIQLLSPVGAAAGRLQFLPVVDVELFVRESQSIVNGVRTTTSFAKPVSRAIPDITC